MSEKDFEIQEIRRFPVNDGNVQHNLNADKLDGLSSEDFAPLNHQHDFADVNNKPTTLSGYGIIDATRKYTSSINTTENFIIINHNLNTMDVVASIYEISTNEQVLVDVKIIDENNLRLEQADAFGANIYKIVIIG